MRWGVITLQYCGGFCRASARIGQACPKAPSHLPPHPIPLGYPSVPTLSALCHASNLDWSSIPRMVIYMPQCYSQRRGWDDLRELCSYAGNRNLEIELSRNPEEYSQATWSGNQNKNQWLSRYNQSTQHQILPLLSPRILACFSSQITLQLPMVTQQ